MRDGGVGASEASPRFASSGRGGYMGFGIRGGARGPARSYPGQSLSMEEKSVTVLAMPETNTQK
jgi:hypothetical protein